MAIMNYEPLEHRDLDMPISTMVFAKAPNLRPGQEFTTKWGADLWMCRHMEKIKHCKVGTCEQPGQYRVRVSRM